MITLNSIEINNFFSHSNSYIDFKVNKGMILILGKNSDGRFDSNGSGKSTILEAIIYALTGNTLRGVGVNDVVNRVVGKDTSVVLSMTIDSDEYIITRYRKHNIGGDSIKVIKNDQDVSKRVNKDTQDYITSVVNIPYTILTSSILLGEGLSSRFTQLSDPDKKYLIESTLTLDYDINTLRDASNSKLKSFKLELSNLLGGIESMRSMLETLKSSTTFSDTEISEVIYKREELQKSMVNLEQVLNDIANKSKVLSEGRKDLSILLSEYSTVSSSVNILEEKMRSLQNEEVKVCELCSQPLTSEESIRKVMDSYNMQVNEFNNKLNDVTAKLNNYPSLEIIDGKMKELEGIYNTNKMNYSNSQYEYNSLLKQCAEMEASKKQESELDSKVSEFNKKLEEDISRKDEVALDISCYDYVYKMFSPTGLITYILQESIKYINDRLGIYSTLLIDKNYKLDFNKGKLSLVDQSGASYQSLSNGEKRRLDICIQFSLHDYIYNYCDVKVNLLFIDEVLDTLDVTGVDNIFEVLRIKMDYCGLDGVYVITHNSDLRDKFDKYILVSKDHNGLSTIEN